MSLNKNPLKVALEKRKKPSLVKPHGGNPTSKKCAKYFINPMQIPLLGKTEPGVGKNCHSYGKIANTGELWIILRISFALALRYDKKYRADIECSQL